MATEKTDVVIVGVEQVALCRTLFGMGNDIADVAIEFDHQYGQLTCGQQLPHDDESIRIKLGFQFREVHGTSRRKASWVKSHSSNASRLWRSRPL